MYCTHCGNEMSDDAKFCVNCGTPVEAASAVLSLPKDPPLPPETK